MEGPEWRGPRGAEAWSGPGGVEGRARRLGDERSEGVGGGVGVGCPARSPGWRGGTWGASRLGAGDLGSWCDREHVWPGPLPTWIEPRHQPCGLGRPCALGPHLGADSSRGFQPRTGLVLRPRSRRLAEDAGTEDRPQHPHSRSESALARRPALGQQSTPAPGGPKPKLGTANRGISQSGAEPPAPLPQSR